MAKLPMLEEDVHGFPQRVIQNLEQFLVHEGIVGDRRRRVPTASARKRKGHRAAPGSTVERGQNIRIALGRPEPHDHVVRVQAAVEPGAIVDRHVQRGERALADDHRMHELDGNVLRVGRIWAATEGEQTATPEEPLRHLVAGLGQPHGLASEERLVNVVAPQQLPFDVGGSLESRGGDQLALRRHQQILGSGSPTSMSTTRLAPYRVIASTVPAGCATISPMMRACSPPASRERLRERPRRGPARRRPGTGPRWRYGADRVRAVRRPPGPRRAPVHRPPG